MTDGPLTGLDIRRWTGITLAPEDPSQGGVWRFVSFTCRPEAAADPEPSARVLALSAEQPRSACTATYRLIPGTEVVLSKSAAGPADAREGSARLHITRTDDDSQTLELPKADDSASTSDDPLAVYGDDVSCTVSEPDVGVGPGATAVVNAALDRDGTSRPLYLPGTLTVDTSAKRYTVEVVTRYILTPPTTPPPTSPPPTTPPPTSPPPTTPPPTTPPPTTPPPTTPPPTTPPPTTPPPTTAVPTSPGGLPHTGGAPLLLIVSGLALLAAGTILVAAVRYRGSRTG